MPSIKMPFSNAKDAAVEDNGDDDGQDDGQPHFHIRPDSITPRLVLLSTS